MQWGHSILQQIIPTGKNEIVLQPRAYHKGIAMLSVSVWTFVQIQSRKWEHQGQDKWKQNAALVGKHVNQMGLNTNPLSSTCLSDL